MSTSKVSAIFNTVKKSVIKHSPEILTGMGIAGLLTSTVLAVAYTPKAMRLIDEKKAMQEEPKDLKPTEVVKTVWKCYIPSAVISAASIGCLIGANAVHYKRNAALAMAYTLSETALHDYKSKVIETIGEKKEEVIRDAVMKDKIDKNPASNNEVYIISKGNTLMFDPISSRYFQSDIDTVNRIVNDLNRIMLSENYVSLNDFYYEIGLKSISVGDDIGWNVDKGLIKIRYSAQLTDNNEPCAVLDYETAPYHGYDR